MLARIANRIRLPRGGSRPNAFPPLVDFDRRDLTVATFSSIDFRHDAPDCLGVLLVNLGTPDSPQRGDVRRFLKEFLWDPRVVELPRPLWWILLNGVILNTRPARSAAAYAKIWTEQGSPLMVISQRQRKALQAHLGDCLPGPIQVALAMRYGNPSIQAGLSELRAAGARRLLVLPLYPQYSATTTASIFDAVTEEMRHWRDLPEIRFVNHYHDDAAYIAALRSSIREHWQQQDEPQVLLLSFHGIPKDYFLKGDPYHCECFKTARLLREALGWPEERVQISFQSRVGPKEWLRPYTDETLRELAQRGVKQVDVVCPGFSVDCLETLEEIAMENRDIFLDAGGERYRYIPCLNDRADHIGALCAVIERHIQGWPESNVDYDPAAADAALAQRCALVDALSVK